MASFAMKPISIILDTDIGDDVDDALALAIALNSPEINLLGVSTVFRDAPRRALLAQQILALFNRDVPVRAGCSKPLLLSWDELPGGANLGKQFEALDSSLRYEEKQHAVDFIIETAQACSEDNPLTICPIGPLTNIALLLAKAPEIIPRIRIVLMGGWWSEPKAEWNIRCDPEAAAIVFNSGADITMVGIDVTKQCVLSDAQVEQFHEAGTPRAKFLYDLIKLWQHKVTLHDPLTLLTLFDDCVQFGPRRIKVELCGEKRGCTVESEGAPDCRAAVAVDVDRAVDLFMERVLK
jgi:inosine-uridine nucleoside N-ribohydrolase